MTPIAQALSERLKALAPDQVVFASEYSGVPLATVRRARAGEPISASDFMRIAAAIGYDVMTGGACPKSHIGEFDRILFAIGLLIARALRRDSFRAVAAATGPSPRAVMRACQAEPVSIDTVVKLSRYLAVHPYRTCQAACFTANSIRHTTDQHQHEAA